MYRNMEKTAEKANMNIPGNYDLVYSEIENLMRKAKGTSEEKYDAIMTAFHYGFILGHRATVAGKIQKRL